MVWYSHSQRQFLVYRSVCGICTKQCTVRGGFIIVKRTLQSGGQLRQALHQPIVFIVHGLKITILPLSIGYYFLPTIKLTSRNLEPYPSSFRLETKLAPSASYSHCHRRDVRPQLHARYEKPTLASIWLGTHRYFD